MLLLRVWMAGEWTFLPIMSSRRYWFRLGTKAASILDSFPDGHKYLRTEETIMWVVQAEESKTGLIDLNLLESSNAQPPVIYSSKSQFMRMFEGG